MEEKEILASNLVLYRKKSGLSQLELAKKLNYSNKNVSKWENGETIPSVFILNKIAKIYGISVEDLLVETSSEKEEKFKEETNKSLRRKKMFRIALLLLSNAILYVVAFTLIYALKLANVNFNTWLIILYFTPLTFLSINIYIRVLYKFEDIISLSLFGWLTCLSIYLSLFYVQNMALIFALGGAYQVLAICIVLLINIKILNRKPKLLQILQEKKEKSN